MAKLNHDVTLQPGATVRHLYDGVLGVVRGQDDDGLWIVDFADGNEDLVAAGDLRVLRRRPRLASWPTRAPARSGEVTARPWGRSPAKGQINQIYQPALTGLARAGNG